MTTLEILKAARAFRRDPRITPAVGDKLCFEGHWRKVAWVGISPSVVRCLQGLGIKSPEREVNPSLKQYRRWAAKSRIVSTRDGA